MRFRSAMGVVVLGAMLACEAVQGSMVTTNLAGGPYGFVRRAEDGAVWGWGTYRRVWEHYDFYLSDFDRNVLDRITPRFVRRAREKTFKRVNMSGGKVDFWDSQFGYLKYKLDFLCAVPARNLIKNIGSGDTSSHALRGASPFHFLETFPMSFPLKYPEEIVRNESYDRRYNAVYTRRWKLKQKLHLGLGL